MRKNTKTAGAAIAIRPEFVSQHTAPAVFGFKNARAFLTWLATTDCRVIERGKDRHVSVADVERALLALPPVERDEAGESEPQTSGDVLRALGLRVAS